MKKIILALLLFSHYCYPYPADVYKLTGEDYYAEVKKLLSEAKNSIYISLFISKYHSDRPKSLPNQLLYKLIEAKNRGVEVKVILDQSSVKPYVSQYNDAAYSYLKDAGVEVNYDIPSVKLHDKLIIIDGSIVIIGSHNWSTSALRSNSETSVVINSPQLASEFIAWFNSIQISPPRTTSPVAKTPGIYLSYEFLTNPELAVKFSDNTMRLYLYLLKKWEESKHTVIILDYQEVAKLIGQDKYTIRVYRKRINTYLRLLRDRYRLISFSTAIRKPAQVQLSDFRNPKILYISSEKDSFLIPGSFWEFGWMERLSRNGKYFYFISIIETAQSADQNGWWSIGQKYLRKKYHICADMIGEGAMELRRYNVLEIIFCEMVYPFKRYLSPPRYLLKTLYSWEWYQSELIKLKEIYGEEKVEKARIWAKVVFDENNIAVIEKIINLANRYGEKLVQYAADKLAKRIINNPKRSINYMEAIVVGEFTEAHDETED